ncbi:bifunctional tRNA pseudouridine(32) synthase/23S rRNA pseudouridine(746) synthase RluA [Kordiimonas sp. SCSIO 12610]|uniref:bifunctional tRNA pseudouridine(32) synthase/23S rRNA pseudouridine(746) synthase RluA n=1 Tax=Kordiimonas sp. SCSIO 12610 TaxID=2829597 RepID=UPI0021091FD7|nr:bifunctional tRNA pseudouridine(32) synthase/23S rRNA pseudouridine(746) synthase RluA [Kordiimonas sp. SCSIO 12610]UTW55121.1 bifunctional tRNA pseudouridine(32) synthase/23S rRNA pseudouridine(746) synthase RluA [Kordiimonas sp. SCSIO 12610]
MFDYNPPTDPLLQIVYQDDDIIVLNKQSGLLSVPGKHDDHKDCLESRVQAEFVGASTIHRLDMDTSGLLVMAMHKDAHRYIGYQFEHRLTSKTYIARVYGNVKEDRGSIDLPLICDWPNRPKQKVDHDNGRSALTHYEVIDRGGNETRVKLTPVTGRSHQLRVHMLELGHPILGDRFYADGEALEMAPRLMLHAEAITIRHPSTKQMMTFNAGTPF